MKLTFALVTAGLLAVSGASRSELLQGRVVGVTDGDTITVLDPAANRHKIRLGGIDAPETGQPYGNVSKQSLAKIVFGRTVSVDVRKIDAYGRLIGNVRVMDSDCDGCNEAPDVNYAQVMSGMAWWYREYANEQPEDEQSRFAIAEDTARSRKIGLWRERSPIAPWVWRHHDRPAEHLTLSASWQCGTKHYCREMTSCAEAMFHMQRCGLASADGDHDGVPCENVCAAKGYR